MVSFNWEAPRCLVSSDPGGLKVVRSTIDLLKKIKVKVTVVSIAGPYRTGKSYLMNRLAGKNTGFDIGSTIQAETKGIWAWCRPHPMDRDTCLLLLDTEGLGDPEKGDKNYDAWIFTLAVLLSTTLVYNTLGTINQDALNELHLVTKLSEHMQIRSNANNDTQNFAEFFPNFVWAVRDFWLDLVIDGKPCTANEYMEKMLELRKGVDWKTKEYNKVRHCVRRYFPSRNCFVFPRPVKDMEKIKTPERLTYPDFEVEFLKVSEGFIEHIRDTTDSRAKSIFGAPLTGSALAGLCEHYVQKIQEGGIPCIENGVETISERENEKAMKDAIQFYKEEMSKISLPTETVEQLSRHHDECQKGAIAIFMDASLFDNDQKYQSKLVALIMSDYQAIYKENEQASCKKCQEILKLLYSKISLKLQSGDYVQPGGYSVYKNDLDNLQTQYEAVNAKGVKATEMWQCFMEDLMPERRQILVADHTLTNQQKEIEEQKRIAEEATRRAELEKEEEEKQRELFKVLEQSHKENMEQLETKLKAEMNTQLREQDEQVQMKLADQKKLLKEGFEEESAALYKEIRELKMSIRDQRQVVSQQQSHGLEPIVKVLDGALKYFFKI